MSAVSKADFSNLDCRSERILAASKKLFLEFGYAMTSMDLVARRAGVSKTTLYTRFSSKEELCIATIQAACERCSAHFTPDLFDDLPLEETLFQAGRRFVDLLWSAEAVKIHQLVLSEAAHFPSMARLYFQTGQERVIADFTALFERIAERGLAQLDDPAFMAKQFLAALRSDSYCALKLGLCDHPTEGERDAFLRKAVTLFIKGVQPTPG